MIWLSFKRYARNFSRLSMVSMSRVFVLRATLRNELGICEFIPAFGNVKIGLDWFVLDSVRSLGEALYRVTTVSTSYTGCYRVFMLIFSMSPIFLGDIDPNVIAFFTKLDQVCKVLYQCKWTGFCSAVPNFYRLHTIFITRFAGFDWDSLRSFGFSICLFCLVSLDLLSLMEVL